MSNTITGYDKKTIDFLNHKFEEAEDAGRDTSWIDSLRDGYYDGDVDALVVISEWMSRYESEAFSHF